MFTRNVQVRFSECDGLGHVNNGKYFDFMEDARIDVFRLFNPTLDLSKWNLIVASTRCDFLHQVTYGETLTIYTWISKIGNSSFAADHAIATKDGTWAARGQATLIAFDYEKGSTTPLWPEVRAALEKHQKAPSDAPVLRG